MAPFCWRISGWWMWLSAWVDGGWMGGWLCDRTSSARLRCCANTTQTTARTGSHSSTVDSHSSRLETNSTQSWHSAVRFVLLSSHACRSFLIAPTLSRTLGFLIAATLCFQPVRSHLGDVQTSTTFWRIASLHTNCPTSKRSVLKSILQIEPQFLSCVRGIVRSAVVMLLLCCVAGYCAENIGARGRGIDCIRHGPAKFDPRLL